MDRMKKFKGPSPNHRLINDLHRMAAVADWNNMEASLVALFNANNFPPQMYDFSFSYSLLKSDPKLDCAQQAHCDQAPPNTYGNQTIFIFSAIIRIE